MSSAPLPAEEIDATDALLGRARRFILGMLEIVRSRMDGRRRLTAKHCRELLAEFVAPAEAALRRAIAIIAAGLPLPHLRPRAAPTPGAPSPAGPVSRASPEHPLPVFRHSEAPPQAAAARPAPTTPTAPITRAPADPYAAQNALLRRLEALEIAAAFPVREAERWRRRQARTAPPAPGEEPILPLDFFGLPQSWLHLPGDLIHLLLELNLAALQALTPDTS